ncbi:hypothetical protein ACKUFS_02675 [Pseudomonas cannabina]|uniref:Uncharacterized protein n=2 Tax=Pseudomonas syringae group TaxID=136849 RepID=A0A8T8C447_PSEYM|nr:MULTISPECIES: hypothetical protein [Pseudomonas syringae group]MBM0142473.1 hypothetical protein [Pseudomonas cannabina pv. alisalensis]QHE98321.1 hypothetical protein PMA4326_018090 [Pseudomonas syringae pv. maculicola str. ES4326]QQN23406.1 hypothetical protein JGS08_07145 [Pseudomonas cannabina pv. alisalensis]UBY98990.1 hypothetical protein LCG56_07745 [Pseudomonas cannabina pv. alisalensis]
MTEVIERSVSLMMQGETFDLPEWVKPISDEKTITLQRIVSLTWSESEVIRILRTSLIAPALLSSEEAHIAVIFFKKIPYRVDKDVEAGFWGDDDPFEGVEMTSKYYAEAPRFNIGKCVSMLEKIREHADMSVIDLGLAFRGKLGDMRVLKTVPVLN